MSHYSALHRALGEPPGEFTDAMIQRAVDTGLTERADLDWKKRLPPQSELAKSDFPKDVAAMANGAGGVIVFGVTETEKAATGREHQDRVTENYERTLRQVTLNDIHPPVPGVVVKSVGDNPGAVVVSVPASPDRPHLIFRGDAFWAPVRNDADTVYMTERALEAAYQSRFESRRESTDALTEMFRREASRRGADDVAWVVLVARPRVPATERRLTDDDARSFFAKVAVAPTPVWVRANKIPRIEDDLAIGSLRAGFRSWLARPNRSRANELRWATIRDDGGVTLAGAVGGQRTSSTDAREPQVIVGQHVEMLVARFMTMLHVARNTTPGDYDVLGGFVWNGSPPLRLLAEDSLGLDFDPEVAVTHVERVLSSVPATSSDERFGEQACDLALDLINQGGVTQLRVLRRPEE